LDETRLADIDVLKDVLAFLDKCIDLKIVLRMQRLGQVRFAPRVTVRHAHVACGVDCRDKGCVHPHRAGAAFYVRRGNVARQDAGQLRGHAAERAARRAG